MVEIRHGDLLEQRRGGVDVLRVMVRTLAAHEQSGAVNIRSSKGGQQSTGWLLFRLGQPVMAFHQGDIARQGLEALLCIEEDALEVNNDVELYELGVQSIRSIMSEHPESVLHLEHQKEANDSESWWSSVRLPSSSWRRASRLEDIEEIASSTEHRQRSGAASNTETMLTPGGVYISDSPDPHPMIHLAVELAERGMPMLGLFGLPHADTEVTKRLPSPQCFALLSPHGGFDVLADRDAIQSAVEGFQWGSERSLVLIDGLDRLGNAMGDEGMIDIYRSICDAVRLNDHIVLCTTDLEMFETKIRHALLAESTLLRSSTLDHWLDEPDVLWDHPILLARDEEEEQWLAAQIQQQGAKLGARSSAIDAFVEGGSVEVDEQTMAEATEALTDVVAAWHNETTPALASPEEVAEATLVGATAWKPEGIEPVNEGRFVSESPRLNDVVEAPVAIPARRRSVAQPAVVPRPVELRKAQRLPKRKADPSLPLIDEGLSSKRSSAVVKSVSPLPDWPERQRKKEAYRKENMDGFTQRQEQALERQQTISMPHQAKSLRDNVASSPDLDGQTLPSPHVPQTVQLPSKGEQPPLSNSLREVDDDSPKAAREAASLSQRDDDIEAMYERWSTFDEPDGLDSTALYSEKGEMLKRYKGE